MSAKTTHPEESGIICLYSVQSQKAVTAYFSSSEWLRNLSSRQILLIGLAEQNTCGNSGVHCTGVQTTPSILGRCILSLPQAALKPLAILVTDYRVKMLPINHDSRQNTQVWQGVGYLNDRARSFRYPTACHIPDYTMYIQLQHIGDRMGPGTAWLCGNEMQPACGIIWKV